jgi:hypothetical protein
MKSTTAEHARRQRVGLAGVLLAALALLSGAARAENAHDAQINGLAATFVAGKGAVAPIGVVIIPGSGPTDRNGNSVLGIRTDTYKLLAEALAERGISSVRYD